MQQTDAGKVNKYAVIRICVLILAAVFIAVGVWHGEVTAVFEKGIHICLECLGIG